MMQNGKVKCVKSRKIVHFVRDTQCHPDWMLFFKNDNMSSRVVLLLQIEPENLSIFSALSFLTLHTIFPLCPWLQSAFEIHFESTMASTE